jgi:membrane protein
MAGSIAYHAFLSLLPFLLLVLFVVSQFGTEQMATTLVQTMAEFLTPDLQENLVSVALNAAEEGGISVVGGAVLVWGTLRIFRGLDTAFSDIYESESENTFLDQVLDGIVVFGAIGVAIFVIAVADAFVGLPSFGAADPVVRPLVSMLTLAVAFLPMYYVFPDEDVTVREVLPGAFVAAAGWTALSVGFGFYVQRASATDWGLVGAIILLVTWLYFGGLILLVGASLNAVLAGRSDDVADIAWGKSVGADPAHNDADFVGPTKALRTALDGEQGDYDEVVLRVGETEVTVPRPDDYRVDVSTVERPRLLGGNRETARVVLEWDSWGDRKE